MTIQEKPFTKDSERQKNPEAILPAELGASSVGAGPISRSMITSLNKLGLGTEQCCVHSGSMCKALGSTASKSPRT